MKETNFTITQTVRHNNVHCLTPLTRYLQEQNHRTGHRMEAVGYVAGRNRELLMGVEFYLAGLERWLSGQEHWQFFQRTWFDFQHQLGS